MTRGDATPPEHPAPPQLARRLAIPIAASALAAATLATAASADEAGLTICNRHSSEVRVASVYYSSWNGQICVPALADCPAKAEGWVHIRPGGCREIPIGTGWGAFLSLQVRRRDGSWRIPPFPVADRFNENRPFARTPMSSGLSGEMEVCMSDNDFSKKGSWPTMQSESCPAGYRPMYVNMFAVTDQDTEYTVNF